MKHIVVLGAGVMGSALCVPATASGNKVSLVGSPLDDAIIDSINANRYHPTLDLSLPGAITALKSSQCSAELLQSADVIVFGVSSAGISWASDTFRESKADPQLLSLVTKGLCAHPDGHSPPLTYANLLPRSLKLPAGKLVGIGGPCIARELASGVPTRVIFGSENIKSSHSLRDMLESDIYRIKTTTNFEQMEACAALKNFLCIGVSAMLGQHQLADSHAKNPLAALFNQAVIELRVLSDWIANAVAQPNVDNLPAQASDQVAFDLAGMGDLHVTVGGGRNSRLGHYLGQGIALSTLLQKQMQNITVEGVDTGREISSGVHAACQSGALDARDIPLTLAILGCIDSGDRFTFDFTQLPG